MAVVGNHHELLGVLRHGETIMFLKTSVNVITTHVVALQWGRLQVPFFASSLPLWIWKEKRVKRIAIFINFNSDVHGDSTLRPVNWKLSQPPSQDLWIILEASLILCLVRVLHDSMLLTFKLEQNWRDHITWTWITTSGIIWLI